MVDTPSLNILQQLAMSQGQGGVENVLNYQRQSALARLAADPDFRNLPAGQQNLAIAQITGSPALLQLAGEQNAVGSIDTGSPALSKLLPYLGAQGAVGALTNPLLMSGPGGMNPPSSQPPQASTQPTSSAAPTQIATQRPVNPQPPSPDQNTAGLNMDYLNTAVPPFYRAQVLDVIHGGELPKDMSFRDRTMLMNWAHNVDPSFTETRGALRYKMAQDIASNAAGSQGGQAVQLNSVIGHLYDLYTAAPNVPGKDSPWVNSIAQGFVQGLGTSALPGLSKYEEILNRASPELNKFYVGGEGDKEGRALGTEAFATNLPLAVKQDNIKTQLGLLHSKISSLQQRRDDIMGNATSPVVTPTTAALMKDIRGLPLTPQEQSLINAHRAESNLPPKQWPQNQWTANPVPLPSEKPNAGIDLSKITPEMARAELARRAALKGGK